MRGFFDAGRQHKNVKLTCWSCGHVSILHAAALWWLCERKGWPDTFQSVLTHAKCVPCLTKRNQIIRNPRIELTDAGQTVELPMPSELTWKQAVRRSR